MNHFISQDKQKESHDVVGQFKTFLFENILTFLSLVTQRSVEVATDKSVSMNNSPDLLETALNLLHEHDSQ